MAALDWLSGSCSPQRVDTIHAFTDPSHMRDRILSEIKRLAAENGGKAPGKAYFQQETGIAESDWYGKAWLRWNDVVADAGLIPNEKQERLSSDMVLDKYAEVCRHYGKPPSSAELRFYARETPTFISHNTFAKHFGSKDGVIAALRDRAIERGDEDLIVMLPQVKAYHASTDDRGSTNASEGWVYLLQSGNHFKIGRSDELERRVKQISIALPAKVELVHAIKTDDPPGIEGYWHRRFAQQRANGEWFKLSQADVRAFKRRKFQ
ncbi:GIY-YIG nuclease family protein [Tabrizicola sp.]|uniref:GIY-YIG nuclease family protein n=1 Tax=Tabrizicola sp. TaxID=2005166 RepID=UPI003F66D705